MVMQRVERAFRPGQVARARLTITNDGDVPMRYAVEVSPGVTAPFVGFVAEETSVLVTDPVQPGRSATVRVPLSLPADIAEGRKVVRVRIGEAGPEGEILNVLDEEFFSGLCAWRCPGRKPRRLLLLLRLPYCRSRPCLCLRKSHGCRDASSR